METPKCPQIQNLAKITSVQVRARIRDDGRGAMVEAQRGKYKHWFPIGIHAETDAAFKSALATGKLVWSPEILGPAKLF